MRIDGSGRVQLVQSMPVLRPDEQVLQCGDPRRALP